MVLYFTVLFDVRETRPRASRTFRNLPNSNPSVERTIASDCRLGKRKTGRYARGVGPFEAQAGSFFACRFAACSVLCFTAHKSTECAFLACVMSMLQRPREPQSAETRGCSAGPAACVNFPVLRAVPLCLVCLTLSWPLPLPSPPQAYAAIIKYTPPGLLPAVWGAVLCFFGGEYMTLIAAVEAFELSGGYNAGKAATVLAEQAFAAIDASAASNKAALDKLEPRELVAHKMAVAMNTLDPEATQDALGQLYLCAQLLISTPRRRANRTPDAVLLAEAVAHTPREVITDPNLFLPCPQAGWRCSLP